MGFKNKGLPVENILQSKGKLLDTSPIVVMGIININTDSFVVSSRKLSEQEVLDQAGHMIEEGAQILDIGGVSTRPGAAFVTETAETERTVQRIEAIRKHYPDIWISIDTYRANVAKHAVAAGADLVNDISGGHFDADMIPTIAHLRVPFVIMHLQGSFETMHQRYQYTSLCKEVTDALATVVNRSKKAGIKDIIVDPGFGFSKDSSQNFELLNNLSSLRVLGQPILAGLSRKSMIYKTLGIDSSEALNGTTALHMVALQQGASILRVHDVKAAKETIQLYQSL